MKLRIGIVLSALAMMLLPALHAQPDQAAIQQRVTEMKASMAANKKQLMKYQWLQTTTVSIKGKTRKDEQFMCQYGPDGKVQKTVAGTPSAPPQIPTRGLRGKMAEKKVDEMKDYTERLKSLISHYAPPEPDMIQAAVKSGNASMNRANGVATLSFANYYKAGDKVSFGFDTTAKKLVSYNVNTYLDDPKTDIVTLTNQFASLPDGTNYLQQTVLNSAGKQITVTTTNSGYSLPTN